MLGTIIIGIILLAAFVCAARSVIKTRKKGGCGCGCADCPDKCGAIEKEV